MNRLPAALFLVDVKKEHIAVAEALKLNIPTFAIVPEPPSHYVPSCSWPNVTICAIVLVANAPIFAIIPRPT